MATGRSQTRNQVRRLPELISRTRLLNTFIERKSERIAKLSPEDAGRQIIFKARVHHARAMSKHILFLVLRQGAETIQGVLTEGETVSQNMVLWAESIHNESVVWVEGTLQIPQNDQSEVKTSSVHDIEVKIEKVGSTPHVASICNSLCLSCTWYLHQQLYYHFKSRTSRIRSQCWRNQARNTRKSAKPLDSTTGHWIYEHQPASQSFGFSAG